ASVSSHRLLHFSSQLIPPLYLSLLLFFFTPTAPTQLYTLSLHDALPISTDDDLTREAFSNMSQIPLVEHTGTLEKLHQYFHSESREMPNNNLKMSKVFKDAYVLPNSVGMAPGMIISHRNKTWIFLPGVPKEMKSITTEHVLPYIRKQQKDTIIESLTLKFIGIGESKLETE